jgi:hypothetical protein
MPLESLGADQLDFASVQIIDASGNLQLLLCDGFAYNWTGIFQLLDVQSHILFDSIVRYQTLNAARKDKEPRAEVAADAEVKKGEEYSFLKQFHRPPRPLRPLCEAF